MLLKGSNERAGSMQGGVLGEPSESSRPLKAA